MHIKFYMSEAFACGHIRGEVLAREINKRFTNVRMDCKTDVLLSDFYSANIAVFQRQEKLEIADKMRIAREEFKIKVVYDIDDDLFRPPEDFIKPYAH